MEFIEVFPVTLGQADDITEVHERPEPTWSWRRADSETGPLEERGTDEAWTSEMEAARAAAEANPGLGVTRAKPPRHLEA